MARSCLRATVLRRGSQYSRHTLAFMSSRNLSGRKPFCLWPIYCCTSSFAGYVKLHKSLVFGHFCSAVTHHTAVFRPGFVSLEHGRGIRPPLALHHSLCRKCHGPKSNKLPQRKMRCLYYILVGSRGAEAAATNGWTRLLVMSLSGNLMQPLTAVGPWP